MRIRLFIISLLTSLCCYAEEKKLLYTLSLADSCGAICAVDLDFRQKRYECVHLISDSFYINNDTLLVIESYDYIFRNYHVNILTNYFNYRFEYKNDTMNAEKFELVHFDLNHKMNKWDINTCIKDTFLYDYNMAVDWSENGTSVSLDDHTILICTLIERNKTDIFLDRLVFFRSWIEQRLFDSYQRKWYPYLYYKENY